MTIPGDPLISVCIPTYNGGTYLAQCIDSILAQTFTDFEIIILDDCSSDNTAAVANTYATIDKRIRFAQNAHNLGMVANWNRCIELAHGTWIKFVFQDDFIHSTCLARMLERAKDGIFFVACKRAIVFEAEDPDLRKMYAANLALIAELFAEYQVVSAERCQEWALRYFGYNFFGEPSAVMIHREVFRRFGYFNPALIMSCDLEFWIRLSVHTGAAYVDEELATFRVHETAMSALNLEKRWFRANILDNLIILHQYLFDPMYEPVRRAAARLSPPIDLEQIFARRCREARASADWARRDDLEPDESLMAEWKEVTKVYPRIAGNYVSHFLWRIRGRLFSSGRRPMPLGAAHFLD